MAKSLKNWLTYKTKKSWHSIDAQFQNGAQSIAFSFAYKGSLYIIYECLQPIARQINQDANPNIVDAPLTLIFRMGQGVCHFPFGL